MLPQIHSKDDKVRIGVLLAPPPVQVLDLAPVDVFHMMSKEYMGTLELFPQPIKDLAMKKLEILYIADQEDTRVMKYQSQQSATASTPDNASIAIAPLTADLSIKLTSDLNNPKVQPGELTILMIPGPDPSSHPSERCKSFIRSHATCGTTDIITVCTGIYPACHSGICDGKKVSCPRGLIGELGKKFKNVKSFEDTRWSCDHVEPSTSVKDKEDGKMRRAELWTAAGISNGHDCVAAYVREHFQKDLGEIILRMADIGDRPQQYDAGRVVDGMWWVSTILGVVFKGFWRRK